MYTHTHVLGVLVTFVAGDKKKKIIYNNAKRKKRFDHQNCVSREIFVLLVLCITVYLRFVYDSIELFITLFLSHFFFFV